MGSACLTVFPSSHLNKAEKHKEAVTGVVFPDKFKNNPKFAKLWNEWCSERLDLKFYMTTRAAQMALKQLAGFNSPLQALENAIAGGWKTVYDVKENQQSTCDFTLADLPKQF